MIYGYARVSSNGQDLTQQVAQLLAAGCVKVYQEKASAASAERPKLKRAIGGAVREGRKTYASITVAFLIGYVRVERRLGGRVASMTKR